MGPLQQQEKKGLQYTPEFSIHLRWIHLPDFIHSATHSKGGAVFCQESWTQVHKQVLAMALHDRTRKNKNNSLTQHIQTELYLSLSTEEKKPKLSHAIPSQGDA